MPAASGKKNKKKATPSRSETPVEPESVEKSNSSEWSVEELTEFDEFHYVRFTYADIHGIGRCRSVARRHVTGYLMKGIHIQTRGCIL